MPWLDYHEGQTYSRSAVDASFMTHQGRGIWVRSGIIIAFTSYGGLANGYEDGREGDMFLYYGMGPKGDMSFRTPENEAIRTHQKRCDTLILFDEPDPRRSEVRFVGQFLCYHYRWQVRASAADDRVRSAIVFELTPVEAGWLRSLYPWERSPIYDNGGWQRRKVS
jgi:hypothetical protein